MEKYTDYTRALRELGAEFRTDQNSDAGMNDQIIIINKLRSDLDFSPKIHLIFKNYRLSKIYFGINEPIIIEIPNFFIEYYLSKINKSYEWSNSLFKLKIIYKPPADHDSIIENLVNISKGNGGFEEFYENLKLEYNEYISNQENWLKLNCPERLQDPIDMKQNSNFLKIVAEEFQSITNLEAPKGFIEFELLFEMNQKFDVLKLIVKNPHKVNRFSIKDFIIPITLNYSLKDLVIDIEGKLINKVPVNEITELNAGPEVRIFDKKQSAHIWGIIY